MTLSNTRRAIESTYTDVCTIYGFKKTKTGGITKSSDKVKLYENEKCALSQKTLKYTNQTDSANIVTYDAKLFLAPEIIIKPGCHIEVTRYSRTLEFISAGEPFVYETHQEILLLRKDKA